MKAEGRGQSQAESQEFLSSTLQQVTLKEVPPCCTTLPYSKPPRCPPKTFRTTKERGNVCNTVGRDDGTRWTGAGLQGRELEEWMSLGVDRELEHWVEVGWG